ncbi:muscarinic acetylcholine receptor M1 [Triplophysa rosa]|uniref:Muscarinic acetylcholine receptor n=1 Tax=Triplophysa rosa TaxID=992332 RepID=A0A9W7TRC6_TRIRA|nr:muscarinic acetylcholine receptor M1 [Triplophysa rosa]KAI7801386.1 putative muscarinic acetylcholine receptor M3-like [Triplophysa rosa]
MNISTFTLNLSSLTNATDVPDTGPVTWRMAMITLVTVPLSLITIIGNILVMISFRVNPLLRTVSNYFLLSLAVADVILGAVSMNLYTTYILIGRWTLGNLACDIWLAVDYVASNASVMNLLAISVDRYLSVTRPLTYRATRTPRRAAVLIALAWGVSFVLWAPAILFWQYIVGERTVPEDECSVQFLSQPVITFGTAIAAFYLPVSVMVALYWRVYRETEKRSQQLAGLIASQGRDAGNTSQRSCTDSSSVEDVRQQTDESQHSKKTRTICPTITHRTAAWWKKRERVKMANSDTTHNHPQIHISQIPDEDDNKYIPLVRMDETSVLTVQDTDCQSDSQHSLNLPIRPVTTSNGTSTQPRSPPLTTGPRCLKTRTSSLIREKKAARTLSAILLAFIVTWTPYNIMVLVSTFCDDCVPEGLWQLGYWLCYVNSTVNPVCYALCNRHFRVTFKALLLCRWKEQRKGIRWTPTGNG